MSTTRAVYQGVWDASLSGRLLSENPDTLRARRVAIVRIGIEQLGIAVDALEAGLQADDATVQDAAAEVSRLLAIIRLWARGHEPRCATRYERGHRLQTTR